MKSFLVDALRQADGDNKDPADVATTEPAATLNTSDGDESNLQMDVPSTSRAGEELGSESNDDIGDVPNSTTDAPNSIVTESNQAVTPPANPVTLEIELSAPDAVEEFADPVLDSQLAVEPANDDVAGFHNAGIVTARIPLSRYERMIRLLPLACVIAFAIGAAGQVVLTRVTYANLNADLSNALAMGSGSAGSTSDSPDSVAASSKPAFLLEAARPQSTPMDEPQDRVQGLEPAPDTDEREETAVPPASVVRDFADSPPNDAAYPLVESAFDAYQRGAFDQALENYQRALRIEPNHREALSGLAAVYQQLDQDVLALPVYEQILLIEPGNVHAASEVLSIRSRERGWESESEIRHLIQRFPEAHRLHFSLANLLAERGRWADARHVYYQAYSLQPGIAEYSYNLAVSLEALGDLDSAISFYKVAIAEAGPHSSLDRQLVESRLNALSSQAGESS